MLSKPEKDTLVQAVYEIVSRIPYGRITSYGAIAAAVGYPNLSRMVGQIMKGSGDYKEKLPCHRVVLSQGYLSGKDSFDHSGQMQQLLEAEGIIVVNNKIKNHKEICWDPMEEILFDK